MWKSSAKNLPADGEMVVVCHDRCAPTLALRKGETWYVCNCFGEVTHEMPEPDWWSYLPWKL